MPLLHLRVGTVLVHHPVLVLHALTAIHITADEKLVVEPIKKISGEVRLPGSKSLSNRALLLAALAEGTTVVENILVRSPNESLPYHAVEAADILISLHCASVYATLTKAPHHHHLYRTLMIFATWSEP